MTVQRIQKPTYILPEYSANVKRARRFCFMGIFAAKPCGAFLGGNTPYY
jgi:hypothetical protein